MHFDMSDAQMVCVMGKTASLGLLSLSLSAVESKSKITVLVGMTERMSLLRLCIATRRRASIVREKGCGRGATWQSRWI